MMKSISNHCPHPPRKSQQKKQTNIYTNYTRRMPYMHIITHKYRHTETHVTRIHAPHVSSHDADRQILTHTHMIHILTERPVTPIGTSSDTLRLTKHRNIIPTTLTHFPQQIQRYTHTHTIRMEDHRLPKQLLYGKLSGRGEALTGRPEETLQGQREDLHESP